MISFNIEAWRATARFCASLDDWYRWANHNEIQKNEYKPALPFIKATQKRRLKYVARLAFDAAYPVLEDNQKMPCIYASRDGEINRSFDLWLNLLSTNMLSPTSFGLSVHNAVVGQWSIFREDMSQNTAICASEDNFELAFIEAYLLLQEGHEKVLVLVCEDPLAEKYDIPQISRAPFPFAFSCVISQGDQYQLSFSEPTQPLPIADKYFGALSWIKAIMKNQSCFSNHYQSRQWLWQVSR